MLPPLDTLATEFLRNPRIRQQQISVDRTMRSRPPFRKTPGNGTGDPTMTFPHHPW